MRTNPMTCCDYYKLGHMTMDVPGVKTVVSTWTPRHHKHDVEENEFTVNFGTQYVVKKCFGEFFEDFFAQEFEVSAEDFKKNIGSSFNPQYIEPIIESFRKLHKLGYLPLEVWAVPEGTLIPDGCPQSMIFNTHPDFGWLPQFVEDLWSMHSWLPSTSATTAYYRRVAAEKYFRKYSDNPSAGHYLCGDFSMRGMTGHEAAAISGAGHLLSFVNTATIDANRILEQYYGADLEKNPPGFGLPSLEHSVVEKGVAYFLQKLRNNDLTPLYIPYVNKAKQAQWDNTLIAEMCFIIYLLTEVQPTGNFTYVSDTYDYWGVVGKILPTIKDLIMDRDGRFILRPDSGNPVDVILGTKDFRYKVSDNLDNNGQCIPSDVAEEYGTLRCLFFTFGGIKNAKKKFLLDTHIGLIYGDAITAERQEQILSGAVELGFSPENVKLGIGAYTYQFVTRDTRGYAIKAVDCVIEGIGEIPIFKEPKTDSSKKSQKGAVVVEGYDYHGCITKWTDGFTLEEALIHENQLMRRVFRDEFSYNKETIYDIRRRLWGCMEF